MPRTDYDETYDAAGNLISSTPREVSDTVIDREQRPIRLRQARAALTQWASDAEAVSNQGTNVTQAQLKALFGRFAILCRRLDDIIIALVSEV